MLGRGSRVRVSCCTLQPDEVSVPSPVCSVSSSSSVEEDMSCYTNLGFHLWQSQSEIYHPQSDDVAIGTSEDASVTEEKAQTVTFLEKPNRYTAGFSASLPPGSSGDATMGADLKDFLSRPVLINSYTWLESDAIGTTTSINPWQLFFNNTAIKNKLTNYAWLRCDLKIKIMINASPFYYGATLAAYKPLPNFHAEDVVSSSGKEVILLSQRPHIWIYPQNNEGGEMTLPFLWPKNWISTISNQDFTDLGRLRFQVVVPLQSANGVSTAGVTVSTYAWAENVILSGPTSGLVMQSDEYSMDSVSSVASAVSNAAGSLSRVPLIGSFMTATQIGANTVASVAASLGFSNPPVIEDTKPVKNQGIPQLAAPELSYPIEKLTIDPKNELTVDPGALGLPNHDELSLQHLSSKEAYVCTFNWSTADSADALLFSSAVTPETFDSDAATNATLFMTPMCWLTTMFANWRGDIIYRFRFICTQYHRGRVRIIYDPSASAASNILNNTSTQSTVFNEIIDLTKDTNIEVRIPYQQALAWCNTFNPIAQAQVPFTIGNGTTFKHVPNVTNGMFAVRVVTGLTAPVASSTIQVIVSARGADNLEFGVPNDIFPAYSYFAPQSDEYEETESTQVIAGHSPPTVDPNRYLINFGEQIVSLRQIMRRFQYYRTVTKAGSISSATDYKSIKMFKIPPYYGYTTNGWDTAKGVIATGTNFPMNYCATTTLQWVTAAFIGQRGSVNYSMIQDGSYPTFQMVNRQPDFSLNKPTITNVAATGTDSVTTAFMKNTALSGSCTGGIMAANNFTTAGTTWQFPNYSIYKFNTSSPVHFSAYSGQDDSDQQSQNILIGNYKVTTSSVTNHLFIGAGTDYMPVFFINVPTIYVYSTNPVAV